MATTLSVTARVVLGLMTRMRRMTAFFVTSCASNGSSWRIHLVQQGKHLQGVLTGERANRLITDAVIDEARHRRLMKFSGAADEKHHVKLAMQQHLEPPPKRASIKTARRRPSWSRLRVRL